MDKPRLDPRLFSELEIEFLTGYVRPWRRFARIIGGFILGTLAVLLTFSALYGLWKLVAT